MPNKQVVTANHTKFNIIKRSTLFYDKYEQTFLSSHTTVVNIFKLWSVFCHQQ